MSSIYEVSLEFIVRRLVCLLSRSYI